MALTAANAAAADLQVPNRPLRRGENLLEIWERARKAGKKELQQEVKVEDSGAKKRKLSRRQSSSGERPVDIAALIGPQKLGQWMG